MGGQGQLEGVPCDRKWEDESRMTRWILVTEGHDIIWCDVSI